MFVPRPLLRLRALAYGVVFVATSALAGEIAPPALPAWPDQAPSVYAQPTATPPVERTVERPVEAPVETSAAPPIQPVALAQFEAPQPIVEPAKPLANDPRRLTPHRDRHLARTAKRDPAAADELLPSFGVPFESLYTTGAALAVVLGLFLFFAALVRRGAKKSNTLLPEEVVSVLGRVPLTARQYAELVRVGNKLVLISITPAGADPLTEITDPAEIDRLVGLCRSRSKGSSTDEFDKIFRQLADETAPSGFLGNEVPRVDSRSRGDGRLAAPVDVFAAYNGGAQRA